MRTQGFMLAVHKALQYQSSLASSLRSLRPFSIGAIPSRSVVTDDRTSTATPEASIPHASAIPEIISLWFSTPPQSFGLPSGTVRWFTPSAAFDREISSRFLPLIQLARQSSSPSTFPTPPSPTFSTPSPLDQWTSPLKPWTSTPSGTLALLLLLDQFPRNVFRDHPQAYASDVLATAITLQAIARGQDRDVALMRQGFFYLPLMHTEEMVAQVAAVALYEGLMQRCSGEDPQKEEESDDAEADREEARKFIETSLRYAKVHLDVVERFRRFPSRNEVLGRESTEEEVHFLKEHPNGF